MSATQNELQFNQRYVNISVEKHFQQFEIGGTTVFVLVTGVGMVNTIFYLSEFVNNHKVDLIINAGIAGSFDSDLVIGDTVLIEQDCFSDLGVEDDGKFLTAFEANLIDKNDFPFIDGWLNAAIPSDAIYNKYKKVRAITVNTVHGNAKSISNVIQKFNPQIETMEGAAVLLFCNQKRLPCILLRSISNKVETRNKNNWQLIRSINNLNEALEDILIHICTK